jgi:hypothetical protein
MLRLEIGLPPSYHFGTTTVIAEVKPVNFQIVSHRTPQFCKSCPDVPVTKINIKKFNVSPVNLLPGFLSKSMES